MKTTVAAVALALFAGPALAEGDAAKGEKDFRKCKACHSITDAAGENIVKGGKTGPNLYGIAGRQAGTLDGFKYGASIVAAGEGGLVWEEANFVEYTKDPRKFLQATLDDKSAKSAMAFRLPKGNEDIWAYLISVGPGS